MPVGDAPDVDLNGKYGAMRLKKSATDARTATASLLVIEAVRMGLARVYVNEAVVTQRAMGVSFAVEDVDEVGPYAIGADSRNVDCNNGDSWR